MSASISNYTRSTTPTNGKPMQVETPDYPFLIETKGRGIRLGAKRGQSYDPNLTLEAIRDKVARWTAAQDKVDHSYPLNMFHYDYSNGTAKMQVKSAKTSGNRLVGDPIFFTRHGFGQVMRSILPNRGGYNMEQTVRTFRENDTGAKLASLYTNLWATNQDKQITLRTMKTRMPNGDVVRVARSLGSARYAVYDNIDFLNDLLDHSHMADYPVLDFSLQDSAMRIRFGAQIDRQKLIDEGLEGKGVPMFEVWNSETGQREAGIMAGVYKLVCLNGMLGHRATSKFGWRHYGDSERIRVGVQNALNTCEAEANGILRQYNRALDTTISDAFAFMEAELTRAEASGDFRQKVHEAMRDETSSDIGTLAGVVDGITLAAQKSLTDNSMADLLEQSQWERLASRVMDRGLNQAVDNRITLTV